MTERLVSKLHVALLSYDEREIRVRKNYLEEQNPAICCVCFHSGEELLRELRQQRSVDIVVLSSQLEDMDGYEFLKRLNSLHNRPLLLLQGDDWYSDATASFLRPDGRQYLPERSSLLDLLLDLRSSTDIGIFWVLPFCKQLYAEWGIQQPDVNCEYLTPRCRSYAARSGSWPCARRSCRLWPRNTTPQWPPWTAGCAA